jgi:hypothetical protein
MVDTSTGGAPRNHAGNELRGPGRWRGVLAVPRGQSVRRDSLATRFTPAPVFHPCAAVLVMPTACFPRFSGRCLPDLPPAQWRA